MDTNNKYITDNLAGLFTTSLRWVIGWTYFSAFWRRLVLENKLIPEEAGYIGEKFNHFLPNALGIKPIIEYLVTHPDKPQMAMVTFTWVEAIVGLFLILGLFTRLMSIGVFGLAMGILLGSGWIGTTCLDEWQIGILGVAGGFTLFFTGSDAWSLDNYLNNKNLQITKTSWFPLISSKPLHFLQLKSIILIGSIAIFGLTLMTNQIFHGGVWGKLHNKSVRPKVELSNIKIQDDKLTFQIYRTEGADVYGSFLIGVQILNDHKEIVHALDLNDLAKFPLENIHNHYVTKVKPGKHSLIIPLGAKADLTWDISLPNSSHYTLKLIDISGIEWFAKINL